MVKSKDLWLGIFCLLGGTALYFYSSNYDNFSYDVVGGGGFPRLLAIIIFACGLLIGAEVFFKRKNTTESKKAPGNYGAAIKMFVSVLVYIMILTHVGYVVSTLALTAVLLYIQNVKDIKKLTLYSVVIVAALYLLFRVVLAVKLPTGILI